MKFQPVLDRIASQLLPRLGEGRVADYIPPLARVDPRQFGFAVVSIDGQTAQVGEAERRFSIQSISKLFTLALAMREAGDAMWQRIGREPSGNRFNSLVQLEYERGLPRNPFINAGALVVTDVILDRLDDAKRSALGLLRQLAAADDIDFDLEVAAGEQATGFTNTAMAWFIKSFGNLHAHPDRVLDAYFHHCSIAMSCLELARAGLFLANRGIAGDGSRVISARQVKYLNSLMLTCGTYDAVGEFAYRVGLPAKSGVGGGILAVMPGHFSACVWSPGLDAAGNSVLGTAALEAFTTETGLSVF